MGYHCSVVVHTSWFALECQVVLFPIAISSNARNVDPDRGMMPAPSFNYAPKQKREGFLEVGT